jgi:hypothetical protein
MRLEPEDRRTLARLVTSDALEQARAVMNDMRAYVNVRVIPVDELAVHPDLVGLRNTHLYSPFGTSEYGSRIAGKSPLGTVIPVHDPIYYKGRSSRWATKKSIFRSNFQNTGYRDVQAM